MGSDSSATSRPACAARTKRCPRSGSSPTWTNTPGATTSATGSGQCFTRLSRALWRLRSDRGRGDQGHPPSRQETRAGNRRATGGDRRSTTLRAGSSVGGRFDQSDRSGGRSFPSGSLRPSRGASFSIAASKSRRLGTGISKPFSVRCFRCSATPTSVLPGANAKGRPGSATLTEGCRGWARQVA
jgi:hypothetical protein